MYECVHVCKHSLDIESKDYLYIHMYRLYYIQLTGISDSFHFVDIKVVYDGIKTGVEVVEEVNHL